MAVKYYSRWNDSIHTCVLMLWTVALHVADDNRPRSNAQLTGSATPSKAPSLTASRTSRAPADTATDNASTYVLPFACRNFALF